MPLRVIKHQLACPFELTSDSSLIGRNGVLAIPMNNLISEGLDSKIDDCAKDGGPGAI